MREIISDLVHQTKDLFDTVKIVGTEKETKIQSVTKDKYLFLVANLTEASEELSGEWGIGNLALLDGLLNFPSYKTDDAKFLVKREEKPNIGETVTSFVFKDAAGKGTTFRTMAANLLPEQATVNNIPWNVTITPSKSKIAEFAQLSRMLSEVEKMVKISTEDGDLIFSVGREDSSTHHASMVFESGVKGTLTGDLTFDSGSLLMLLKASGTYPMTLNVTSKGVLGVTVEVPTGKYNYYLRAKRG